MTDTTTPVDVIAREIDPWLEWGGERQAATAIITALSEAGWEIVRADQPDAPEITAEMVDAAFAAWYERGIHEIEDLRLNVYEREHMRRALVAALKVRG